MRLGIKVGSTSLVGQGGELQHDAFAHLGGQIKQAVANGHQVALTTSGFAAAGRGTYEIGRRRIGNAWREHLGNVFADIQLVGQASLSRTVEAANEAMDASRVLVTNGHEGDMCFSGNDQLAATIACNLKMDRVVLLGDMMGLQRDINDAGSVIAQVDLESDDVSQYITKASAFGTGGIEAKIAAARLAASAGIVTHYAHWSEKMDEVLVGAVGTTFGVSDE